MRTRFRGNAMEVVASGVTSADALSAADADVHPDDGAASRYKAGPIALHCIQAASDPKLAG